jgi:replicative DNA helicase
MVAISANMLRDGNEVLYVSLEMSEDKISERFEANFLDVVINDIPNTSDEDFKIGISNIKKKNPGRLVIREYPPTLININHIRSLLDELELKKNFKPKILIIDYLNLMLSARYSGDMMYSIIKSIAEEIRGLAVEKELCIITATQAIKSANSKRMTDIDIVDVGESKGLADTVDALFGIIYNEELREQGIQVWVSLKNRFSGIVQYKFPIRVQHDKSQIFDHHDPDFKLCGNAAGEQKVQEEKIRLKKGAKLNFKMEKKEMLGELDEFLCE